METFYFLQGEIAGTIALMARQCFTSEVNSKTYSKRNIIASKLGWVGMVDFSTNR